MASSRTPPTSVTRGATEKASSVKTETCLTADVKSVRLPAPGKTAAVSSAGKSPRAGAKGSTEVVVPKRRGERKSF
jgi:hypothetical protein